MRRIIQLAVLSFAAAAATACDLEEVVTTPDLPAAGVRFINAVPDHGPFDLRFVDIVESNAHWNINFRNNPVNAACVIGSTHVQYKAAQAGQRHFRIFRSGNSIEVASTVIKDTVVTLEAGKNYTALLTGYYDPAGAGRPAGALPLQLSFFEEDVSVPDGQVALRVINTSVDPIDASYYASSGTAPGTTIALNVAPMSRSPYVNATPGSVRFNTRPAGDPSFSFADQPALAGAAAVTEAPGPIDPTPGTAVAGSAVTAIFFPVSVASSGAPTTGAGFVITTGSTSLSATATGYARAAGNFLNDCFAVGQQITASGFTNPENNGTSIITALTATSLTVSKTGGTVVEAAGSGRTVQTPRRMAFVWDKRPPRPDGI